VTLDELLAVPERLAALETALPARIRAIEMALERTQPARPVCEQETLRRLWTPPLTESESELLPFLAAGWSNREIANQRCVSERTIRTHVSNILTKLQTTNRTTVALWALATGKVSMERAVVLMSKHQPHLLVQEECG
jgi:DNA-binding NarL/FixJ family response regulator